MVCRFRHDERRHAGSAFDIKNHGENHSPLVVKNRPEIPARAFHWTTVQVEMAGRGLFYSHSRHYVSLDITRCRFGRLLVSRIVALNQCPATAC
jgi:hypothetical protein